MLQSVITARLIFALGITNLVTGALIFFSCRCIPGNRIAGKLMKYPAYQRFYTYHCYIWWAFWTSVVVHTILVIAFFGVP
jgi:hypothetical protein